MDVDLAAEPARRAGSDAERRAALALARALRAQGRRDVRTETHWVRPRSEAALALLAGAGVTGSVVAASAPRAGLVVAVVALVLTALELVSVPVVRALTGPRRATQTVVAPAPRARPVTLVLTAAIDGPRRALVHRLPATDPLQLAATAAVLACCAARALGAEGVAIGVVQLVPTALLAVLVAGRLDAALTAPAEDASAPAVVLEVVRALDRLPPRELAVEVVLSGAGDLGLRRWRRAQDRPRETLAVLHIGPSSEGAPTWSRTAHRQLARAAARAAAAERPLQARAVRGRAPRAARAPAIALEARPSGAGGPTAVVALALGLVAELDAELRRARGGD